MAPVAGGGGGSPAGPGHDAEEPRGPGGPGGDGDAAHRIPIEAELDLHAFRPRDIPDVVGDYLDEAAVRGIREVRLVHGKGIGFQRERVRAVLSVHPRVESFHDAPPGRGHWGATVVRLRS